MPFFYGLHKYWDTKYKCCTQTSSRLDNWFSWEKYLTQNVLCKSNWQLVLSSIFICKGRAIPIPILPNVTIFPQFEHFVQNTDWFDGNKIQIANCAVSRVYPGHAKYWVSSTSHHEPLFNYSSLANLQTNSWNMRRSVCRHSLLQI